MERIIKEFTEQIGYEPSIYELFGLYTQGFLTMYDDEEDELIKEFEKNNLM
jgi:hypothetical protein